MCGIAVIWGVTNESLVNEIMNTIIHRGPDSSGITSIGCGTLGHRRLSIMDPRRVGDQPILSENGKTAIVANGEIYNYREIIDRLDNHKFRTSTDTEVALHLYEDEGLDTSSILDGMFAMVIADDNGDIYVARDPLGIKPLYYGFSDNRMVFASELKALSGVADQVNEFPPGTYYHNRKGFKRYYEIPEKEIVDRSVEEMCSDIRTTMDRSVRKRLMSDVPLGAFLSGGLDSSIIAAIASQYVDELHTFSVGLEGSRDLEAARTVSRYLGTIHHEYILTEREVRDYLPEIIFSLESFDQDLVRSAAPCYFVSRLASDYVKVILTGEGADELFGGYTYYKRYANSDELSEELRRSIKNLHNVNLQRVDRLTMAHSIEGRVPFLDLEVIELAQQIPMQMKLRSDKNGKKTEKWILRKAFEGMLPDEIIWRDKEQFDEGSGSADMLGHEPERHMTESEARKYMQLYPDAGLRSIEECIYHNMLKRSYDDPSVVLDNVARWADRPGHSGLNRF